MRSLWAATVAIPMCLALGGMPALAQDEVEPAASLPPPDPVPTPQGSSMLTVEVADLEGMYGLEVAADLSESHKWGPNLFGQIVHEDDATLTASHVLEPGRYALAVHAGAPPCEVRFAPCAGWTSRCPWSPSTSA